MEKRILIAFLLSWIVLVAYQSFIPKKSQDIFKEESVSSQAFENKYDKTISEPRDLSGSQPDPEVNSQLSIAEKIEIIENGHLLVEFSNIGGKIKGITLGKYAYKFSLTDILSIGGYEGVQFTQRLIPNGIVYTFRDENIQILKTFTVIDDQGIISADLSIKNLSAQARSPEILVNNFVIDSSLMSEKLDNHPEIALLEYSISQNGQIKRKDNAYKFSTKENSSSRGDIDWIGYRTRYYCFLLKPTFSTNSTMAQYIDPKRLRLSTSTGSKKLGASEAADFNFIIYAGTQDIESLIGSNVGFEKIVSYSRFLIFDFVSKYSVKLLNFIHRFIPSWGFSIILLGIFVYLLMYPLTMSGMTSMKRMQALQPKMVQLREQNKNNPQKLNKEMMELYKKYKVNPFGGCLPFILQMPIFIGLYQALWRSVSFKGASFLWIKDLSEPDRLFIFPFDLPILGNELNILPILMIGIMVIQQKLSSKNMMSSDPNQIMQQKIMTTIFPVFIGFIFYKFSSGLTLYFTVFYVLSTFTQWKMSKMVVSDTAH